MSADLLRKVKEAEHALSFLLLEAHQQGYEVRAVISPWLDGGTYEVLCPSVQVYVGPRGAA